MATQRRIIHAYYACVSYVDAQIGKILDELEKQGIANNTIIVLWSDHGYHLGDHGLWNKTTNFELSTRTALMIAAPGMKRNVYTNNVTEFVDIYPTICELAGVVAPANLEGKSLVPVLKNPSNINTAFAFGQYNRGNINGYSCINSRFRLVEWIKDFKTYVPLNGKEIVGTELYDYEKVLGMMQKNCTLSIITNMKEARNIISQNYFRLQKNQGLMMKSRLIYYFGNFKH